MQPALRRLTLVLVSTALAACDRSRSPHPVPAETPMPASQPEKVTKSDAEWRAQLTPEQYHVTRQKGTEAPRTGKYWDSHEPGTYRCLCCGAVLFKSEDKYDSECGWPAFAKGAPGAGITETADRSYGMDRTEVTCSRCGAHLGHVFPGDDESPTGTRYCINSASIDLEKKGDAPKKVEPDAKPAAEKPTKPSPGTQRPDSPAMDA
jgi:peptide-methionine (R)-S-oxide reductase